MDKNNVPGLQRQDFVDALQDLGTYIDVSVDDLLQIYKSAEEHALLRNKESVMVDVLMTQPVKTVAASCTLSDAAHILVTEKISGLPVVDDSNTLVGIITEADFLRELGIPSHHPDHNLWHMLEHMFNHDVQTVRTEGRVEDIMMKDVITVSPQQNLHQMLDSMKRHRVKRLVVCDQDKKVKGIITRSDLVRVFFDKFYLQTTES